MAIEKYEFRCFGCGKIGSDGEFFPKPHLSYHHCTCGSRKLGLRAYECVLILPMTNIQRHPTLPHLTTGDVAGWRAVTGDHYEEGVLGIWFPVDAIIPDEWCEEMWLLGKLGGKKKNVVVSRPRGGCESEGVFYGQRWKVGPNDPVLPSRWWREHWVEGLDVTNELGISFRRNEA